MRILILSLPLLLLLARPVLAHSRAEVGPYVIVVGWENEPVIVGERNAVIVEVHEGEAPVEGLEGTLDAAINYAGRTYLANLEPTSTPGLYHIEILPTVRGQYELVLTGNIADMTLNEVLEPEEVLPAAVLEFPEERPDAAAMQMTVNDLTNRLQTAQLLAIGGLVVGVVGIGLAILALVRSRP
jgi:hypothetical protein